MKATLIVVGIVVGLAFATPAHADPGDAQFISFLEQHGLGCGEGAIKCNSDAELTELGHAVCHGIDVGGNSPVEETNVLVGAGQNYINKYQADVLIAAALVAYCPWDESELPSGTS
jgi:hypothetical protein